MNRFLKLLLIALLLGPQIGQALMPVQDLCAEEQQDCCDPSGVCDVTCVQCACCAARPVMIPGGVMGDGLARPAASAAVTCAAAPPSAPPSDILHIPKSV